MKLSLQIVLIVLIGTVFFLGDVPQQKITIVAPVMPDSISYEQGKIFVLSVTKDSVDNSLTASTQWQETKFLEVFSNDGKDAFPKEFIKLFPSHSTIQKVWYMFKFSNYYSIPESVQYAYTDTISVRTFWGKPELSLLLNEVKSTKAEHLLLMVRGWHDSSYTTAFDDPIADNRSLFKLQLHLIPGANILYFAPGGRKKDAFEYVTDFVNESKPLDTRANRFHNSEIEKSCTTCHEGLPSADGGKSMKADCSVCHKAIASGSMIHSPVEMNECVTCHSWSQEKNSMVVTKGVPDACFDCHTEKKITIDSSRVQHPVATDCVTCHSPHASSEGPHLVKKNIYDLCGDCHEDKKMNHPVGKHPVRFAKTITGDEISCVSCHTPHGSENDHLLKVGGNSMMICIQCHNQ